MKISFIGGGNMAAAMIGGMVKQGFAGTDIHVVEPDAAKRAELAQQFGISTGSPDEALPASTAVIFAVKPQQLRSVAAALAPQLAGSLVISIAAGVRADTLGRWLGGLDRVVRVMPNTPALVQAGISGAYASPGATADDKALAERILGSIGETVWVADEEEIDGITAISGSGPAYVFYFIESLQAAARAQGFAPETARKLAYQTFAGAIKLALQSDDDAATLRQKVTSKGGTTERAINALENSQVRSTIIAAASAAAARSRELGEELGRDD
ncbi:pyrroline-5-carboxylate reductase [Andreprevotia lacus DSM 23236]|jgi:pyrroline-5-carboxylate reductase|uniref:Pyrroline-5-carboxylate reductase n=1 Tax=Andreprevotia lacus DSM 23236 TaxID=1121001 RepID=A0A1W1XKX3_9NEIS|nr:pyrroline-5-carboxylate reductase [Andreprevotia lacus]SMC24467.1 pyrroline-5-carboxylate reductase [Andreprevotia lacus DSM 23236]